MKKTLLFLTFLLTSVFVYPQITFERTYGGAGTDIGKSVKQTSDSGYIIAGSTTNFGADDSDVYLIKTDSIGDTLWTKAYGGADLDCGNSVAQTSDGGYIIAGITDSFGAGYNDVYLIRTDFKGDTLWTKTFGGANYDYGYSVAQTFEDGFIITGSTRISNGNTDVYLIKTNSNGATIWTKTFGGSGLDCGNSVAQTYDSGYIIGGVKESFGAGNCDVYLIKTNANGDTAWTKTFGGADCDRSNSVAQTIDSGYIITGVTYSFDVGYHGDIYIIRTDKNGDTLWTKTYGGDDEEFGNSVACTSDGGYIISGRKSGAPGCEDAYLIKISSIGDSLWAKFFGGNICDDLFSVVQTIDGGYITAGQTSSFGAGSWDVYLIKTDTNGISNGTLHINNELSSENNDIAISPNPTSGKINIQLPQHFGEAKTLEIYNCMGQMQWVQNDISTIDISSLSSGLYFLTVSNNKGEAIRGKVIKQ